MTSSDEFRTGTIVLIGIVSAILLFALTVALSAFFVTAQEEATAAKMPAGAPEKLRLNLLRQHERLEGYRIVNHKAGTVTIPIDRAMELTVEELAGK